MYRVLPFLAAANLAMPVFSFPAELWSRILRSLEPGSLLTAVRTSPHWLSITRGDPILRGRVRQEVRRQKEIKQQEMINPSSMMTIIRSGPSRLFQSTNGAKNATCRSRATNIPARSEPVVQILAQEYKRKKGGGKMRKQKPDRPTPLAKGIRF